MVKSFEHLAEKAGLQHGGVKRLRQSRFGPDSSTSYIVSSWEHFLTF